jgi:proline iminopeptidase
VALSLARIECDYFAHGCYLEDNQLVRDVRRLADIPGVIVHGRYDVVCPVDQADELARAWPEATCEIVPDAGHAALEPGIVDALVRATDRLGSQLGG